MTQPRKPILSSKRLAKLCTELWGDPGWQVEIAKRIRYSPRHINEFARDRRTIPDKTALHILDEINKERVKNGRKPVKTGVK